MAIKVMLAPAVAQRLAAPDGARPRGPTADPRPKRRRSSVYDAEGNEVFITLMCLKCRETRPLSQFGLRRMTDGAIRNQPWCQRCRRGASSATPRRKGRPSAERAGGPSILEESSVAESSGHAPIDPGTLAAQVVAALHGGRR
jgi:hypothetical protein